MYYLLRDKDGEAFCAIVIPEARKFGGAVWIEISGMGATRELSEIYDIRQKESTTSIFFNNIGTVQIDWDSKDRNPFLKKSMMNRISRIPLEKLTTAQFETYVLLGLPAVTREETNPFNILATRDI